MFFQVAFLVLVAANVVYGVPFLYSGNFSPLSLITSASSSQQPSNVADLRKQKANQLDKIQVNNFYEEDGGNFHASLDDRNEALPGIVQKKINKILQKIQFITSFSSNNGSDSDIDIETEFEPHNNDTSEASTPGPFDEGVPGVRINLPVDQFEEFDNEKQSPIKKEAPTGGLFSFSPSDALSGALATMMQFFGYVVRNAYAAVNQFPKHNSTSISVVT